MRLMTNRKSSLYVLSGTDTDSLWAFYNRERVTLPSYRLHESRTNNPALEWLIDEIESYESIGIINHFLYIPSLSKNDIHTIDRFTKVRSINYYMFFSRSKRNSGALPNSYYLYEDGKFICQI